MGTKSLAAQTPGALATGSLNLPSIFTAPQEKLKARSLSPYLTFAHSKRADEWGKLTQKFGTIQEGDMFLVRSEDEGGILRLPSAKLGILCAKQVWVETNAAGTEILAASYKEMPRPYKEQIETVVLVYVDDKIVIANCTPKTTKCGGFKTLSDALVEAATTEWLDKSPAHKETAICTQPFMRFYGNLVLGPSRTAKSSGLPYRPTQCTIEPTSVSEWRLLKQLTEDEKTQKAMNDAADRYNLRLRELEQKMRRKDA